MPEVAVGFGLDGGTGTSDGSLGNASTAIDWSPISLSV